MDDNENIVDYQKMNFSTFTPQFTGIPNNAVNQFTTSKFTQNLTTANGQVIGVMSGGEGGVHYLRPVDGNSSFSGQVAANNTHNLESQALITLPITMPGAKPGDAQQTVHIQVINPNQIQQQIPKFPMSQMQIPIQNFQPGGTTVLTVAYSPQDSKIIQNHGFPEGMTVVAALQPQDIQLLTQAQSSSNQPQLPTQISETHSNDATIKTESVETNLKQEYDWEEQNSRVDLSEFITTQATPGALPFNIQQFLKFNSTPIKYEHDIQHQVSNTKLEDASTQDETHGPDDPTKSKRKRRAKKKPPKAKLPKPGQVLIATAIDGTTLFCCPECQMAYPEKENLEQHLSIHKIERRYICDICGAGLKRKEHLERHKSGHSPDRPFICSVCMKGFKRKEHLNLHFVIHSGEKNEICSECGKGFYRKDHLRKHAKSHAAKRLKEEGNVSTIIIKQEIKTEAEEMIISSPLSLSASTQMNDTQRQEQINSPNSENRLSSSGAQSLSTTQPAISLSTVYVPTSNNTTLPVQIQIPQIVSTPCGDAVISTGAVTSDSLALPVQIQIPNIESNCADVLSNTSSTNPTSMANTA